MKLHFDTLTNLQSLCDLFGNGYNVAVTELDDLNFQRHKQRLIPKHIYFAVFRLEGGVVDAVVDAKQSLTKSVKMSINFFIFFLFPNLRFSDTRYRCIFVSLYRKMTNYEKIEFAIENLLRKTERSPSCFGRVSNSSNWFENRTRR